MIPVGAVVGEDIRLDHAYLTIDGTPVDLSGLEGVRLTARSDARSHLRLGGDDGG
jgi:hypothetical protein